MAATGNSKACLIQRLERLERRNLPTPLIVQAKNQCGEEVRLPMLELLERPDLQFVKVISGCRLTDLDALLESIEAYALEEGKASNDD